MDIRGKSYEIVGVLEVVEPAFGPPVPESSYMITDDALALSGAGNVGQIVAEARSADSVDRAAKEIGPKLKSAYGRRMASATNQATIWTRVYERRSAVTGQVADQAFRSIEASPAGEVAADLRTSTDGITEGE